MSGETGDRFRISNTRVGREAQELFWGFFSGTTLKLALKSGLVAFVIFSLAVFTAIAVGADSATRSCRAGPVFEPPAECTAVSLETFPLFLPSMFILLLGSYLSNRRRREKIFQQSSFETALVLLFSIIWFFRAGIGGALEIALLLGAFLAMFSGYRLSFFPGKGG